MNANKLKVAASISGLCLVGCLTANAGDLTVDNLTVNTNATIKGRINGHLTIQSNLNVNGGSVAIGNSLDFNGGLSGGGMSISKQSGNYYFFDYGDSHVAIGDGTYDGSGFSALDYGNGGTLQVGNSLDYGQYNGGTIRVDGIGVGLWDASGASMIMRDGTSSFLGPVFLGNHTDGYAGEQFWVGNGSGAASGRIASGDDNVDFALEASRYGTNGAARLMFAQNADWSGALGFDPNHVFRINIGNPALGANSYVALSIDTSRRVGIGTNAPTERLHVSGNLKVSNGQFIGNGSGLLIAPQGDLSMGTFTAGTQP